MGSFKSGTPGSNYVTQVDSKIPLYGQNKEGGALGADTGRRVITFDIQVDAAVVVGKTDQNAVLWTFDADTLLEGVVVHNIGTNALASGGALALDAGGVDQTPDIQSLAAGAQANQAFAVATERARLLVDGANGIICGGSNTTTLRVQCFIVDLNSALSNAG